MEFFHLGIVCHDLDETMQDLSASMGCTWGKKLGPRQVGPWTLSSVFSTSAPFFELLQGSPGSPWEPVEDNRLHHMGFWSADPESESKRLVEAGVPVIWDGTELGMSSFYHRADKAGVRMEILNSSYRDAMAEANGVDLPKPTQG